MLFYVRTIKNQHCIVMCSAAETSVLDLPLTNNHEKSYYSCSTRLDCLNYPVGVINYLKQDWILVLFPEFRICIWKTGIDRGKPYVRIIYDTNKTRLQAEAECEEEFPFHDLLVYVPENSYLMDFSKDLIALPREDGCIAIVCMYTNSFHVLKPRTPSEVTGQVSHVKLTDKELYVGYEKGQLHIYAIHLPFDAETRVALVEAAEIAFDLQCTREQIVRDMGRCVLELPSARFSILFKTDYTFPAAIGFVLPKSVFVWPTREKECIPCLAYVLLENGNLYVYSVSGEFVQVYEIQLETGLELRTVATLSDGHECLVFFDVNTKGTIPSKILRSDHQVIAIENSSSHFLEGKWHQSACVFFSSREEDIVYRSYDYCCDTKTFYANPEFKVPAHIFNPSQPQDLVVGRTGAHHFRNLIKFSLNGNMLDVYAYSIRNYFLLQEVDALSNLMSRIKRETKKAEVEKDVEKLIECEMLQCVLHVCVEHTMLLLQQPYASL